MKELDYLRVRLSGANLIEASAGTGKTHALTCLYLRLLIERNITPERILVVTYTEAATEELRGRIRGRIREALDVFSGGRTEDAFLANLRDNVNGNGPGTVIARDRLNSALNSFDLATIFTIHGFCLRSLQDNVFESGSLYDTELITDQTDMIQEVVDDFWRMKFFAETAPMIGYALRSRFTADDLAVFLKRMLGNPEAEIRPTFSKDKVDSLDRDCQTCFAAVQKGWRKHRQSIVCLLQSDRSLSRSAEHYRADVLPALFDSMDAFTSGGNPFDLFPGFEKFGTSGIKNGTKSSGTAPVHTFLGQCEGLKKKVEERFLALKWELVAYARERLPLRKREINIRFFDDLLADLFEALCGESGNQLAEVLRIRHPAALVDEFQDTDPVQYDIFRRIYRESECPIFLIGDPKQAIYGFRGADIFAYLRAKAEVDPERRSTLTRNWRSTPQLLAAFNTVFGNVAKPFLLDEIAYHTITPGNQARAEILLVDSDPSPLQVWHVPADQDGDDLIVGKANQIIPGAVAAEIARLLHAGRNGAATIGGRPVLPEDVAVIVRTHKQAVAVQTALRSLGIPSVMRSDKSIFATDEARDVCTLLAALLDPGSESKILAALVTGIFGRTGDDVALLLEDEQAWEECLEKFRAYHQAWLERGFMFMSQALLTGEGVRGRLLRNPDGERRLTNLLHCFEVIHEAAQAWGFGIEGVVTWFGDRVSGEEVAEEYQIRLETDERAVRIVTVHLSKGLEYPIVFCPFAWGGVRTDEGVSTFHDGHKMIKDFGSPEYERHRLVSQKEALAENLRLLYVALTRARFRCYLVGGKIVDRTGKNRPETSALAWLLHSSEEAKGPDDPVGRLALETKSLSARRMREQLCALAAKGNGMISVSPMPAATDVEPYISVRDDGQPLQCRSFEGTIDRTWHVASFTSLATHDSPAAELPDRDESAPPEAQVGLTEKAQTTSIIGFPRGARAGIFLHEIFEKLNFAEYSAESTLVQVERSLVKQGFGTEWTTHVCGMVHNVITAPMFSRAGVFTLADLKPGSWVTELEFFFPLRFITSDRLRSYFQRWSGRHDAADLLRISSALNFRPVRGMVRGFIDMVFEHGGQYYLVDWKSNHLGNLPEHYGRQALKTAMERSLYPLQYLLYTVALNRYLSLRNRNYEYSTCFGGILYVFLRGVNRDDSGIYYDLPPGEMIRELTSYLVESGG
ncbi:MAG TPA: exodeoxyribonuclease V subunit beta [Acidobacteriota bacterium]|nr:exodeoxyribonuclease V subunit beta [Acidobacteriota bacterium]